MKIAIAAITLTMIAGSAFAGQQIQSGAIVCFSEKAYSTQMKALAQGQDKTIPQCGVAGKAIPVIVVEQNLLSASEVQAVDNGMTLFVSIEDLVDR